MQFLPFVLSAVGSIAQGSAQSAAYKAQAQAEQYNAAVMRQRAETTNMVYGQREEAQRRAARIEAGERRAAMAQSGVGLGGSTYDVERQSEIMAELDALNIRYEGQLESKSALDQSNLHNYYSGVARMNAKTAKTQGYLGAATSILSGVSSYGKGSLFSSKTAAPIVSRVG